MDHNTKFLECKAPDCKNNTVLQKDLQFFPFPTEDEERCQVWLALSGNHDLINETNGPTVKKLLLCADHFELDQFEDLDRTILSDAAVPTVFSFSVSPGSPSDMEFATVQGEVSDYDPDNQETEVEATIPNVYIPDDEVVEIRNDTKKEVETKKAVPSTSVKQIMTKTITATVGGQKRILMAVPKEMYISAVKSGKFSFAKPLNTSQPIKLPVQAASNNTSNQKGPQVQVGSSVLTKKLPVQEAASNNTSNQKGPQVQVGSSVPTKPYGAAKRKLPHNLRRDKEISRKKVERGVYLPLEKQALSSYGSNQIRVEKIVGEVQYPPVETEPRVFQVAPELPVQAQPVTVSTFDWKTLTPDGWQDWPVPIDVFLASAVQLKNNYLKLFPKKDRMDIETTLHLAANYKNLGIEAKAHVRARVHHFLKILQIEKAKLNEANENSEN